MEKRKLLKMVDEAHFRLKEVVTKTPLQLNKRLSEKYGAKVYLKREDLQLVRSYKLRGAFNFLSLLNESQKLKGVVCASAGNHAQGVAFACDKLKVFGHIYMPQNTPRQKVERVKSLGGKWVTLELVGETYDESYEYAKKYCDEHKNIFVHPFDDPQVIAGQGTVAVEILEQLEKAPDYVVVPVGGGGLLAGLGTYLKNKNKKLKVIGVEPSGAPSMSEALKSGKVVTLKSINKFVDGAAVKTVGALTFALAKKCLDKMLLVEEGKVCEEMISLYQNDGMVTEPAGALSVAALDLLRDEIKGKTVVCVVSGGNNDLFRYPEIIEKSLEYQRQHQIFSL